CNHELTQLHITRADTAEHCSRADTAAITELTQLQSRADSCNHELTQLQSRADTSCNHGMTARSHFPRVEAGAKRPLRFRGSSSKPPPQPGSSPEDEPLVAHSALEIRAHCQAPLSLCPCGGHFEIRAVIEAASQGSRVSPYSPGLGRALKQTFIDLEMTSLPLSLHPASSAASSYRLWLPGRAELHFDALAISSGNDDLPCTGVFAVISLLAAASPREIRECGRWGGGLGSGLMACKLECHMKRPTRISANSSSNPGGPRILPMAAACPPPSGTGQPDSLCVRPAANTLRRFRGAFDLLRISACARHLRTRRRPNPFQSVATETVSDTVSPMFGVCLISGYRFAEVESVSPEVASSPPEFEADLESPVSASARASWATATRRHLLEFMNSSSTLHFSQRQLIGSCSVSLGHVIHCGGRVTCQLGCSSADGEATCSIKVEEYERQKETLQLALRGRGLDKKDLFGKSDPYVLLQRRSDKAASSSANSRPQVDDLLGPGRNSELQLRC
uniref:Ubiquitin-like domain-containing protein n=1 Tax=Macrostomum lignano TaxID=282301 RepID=A0A1I8FLL5_9PLAT